MAEVIDQVEAPSSQGKLRNELAHLTAERARLRWTPAAELNSAEYAKWKNRFAEVRTRIKAIKAELGD